MMMRMVAIVLLIVPFALACGGDDGDEKQDEKKEIAVQPTPAPTATPAPLPPPKDLGEGLVVETLELGEGQKVAEGNFARLQLKLTAQDEELFDGEFGFIIGSGQAMPGLDRAVAGMQQGEKRRITIPYELSGSEQQPPPESWPEGEPVTAEVTLLKIEESDPGMPEQK